MISQNLQIANIIHTNLCGLSLGIDVATGNRWYGHCVAVVGTGPGLGPGLGPGAGWKWHWQAELSLGQRTGSHREKQVVVSEQRQQSRATCQASSKQSSREPILPPGVLQCKSRLAGNGTWFYAHQALCNMTSQKCPLPICGLDLSPHWACALKTGKCQSAGFGTAHAKFWILYRQPQSVMDIYGKVVNSPKFTNCP